MEPQKTPNNESLSPFKIAPKILKNKLNLFRNKTSTPKLQNFLGEFKTKISG